MKWFILRRKYKAICKLLCWLCLAIASFVLFVLYYFDNDKSLWPIPYKGLTSQTETPYIYVYPIRQFGPQRNNKVIMLWTKYFKTYEWYEKIKTYTTHCHKQCDLTYNRERITESDGVLFHFTDKDLFLNDLPTERLPHQIWAIYINEPNVFVQESFTPWKNVFNWTVSYRRHSSVFTPYGMYRARSNESKKNPSVYPAVHRDKMAYAVISRCADDAERYRLVDQINRFIPVDYYGECGKLQCEIKHNSCLSPEIIGKYRFKLAFEDSNCRDYVTEKYWDTLERGVIPVVNWKDSQRNVPVPPHSYINVYDFKDIKSLTDYLIRVSENRTLFDSYFEWRKHYVIFTSFWNSLCNFCIALYDKTIPAKVYTDLEGWLRDDSCQRFTYQNQIRRLVRRFLYDGNLVDLRLFS